MTLEQLVLRLKKLPEGEYSTQGDELFLLVATKSEYNVNDLTGDRIPKLMPQLDFCEALDAYKYGLEYATHGKIRYIGTNDLHSLMVSKK